ncbi:hypothetical protein ARMSODRAFT_961845, partial [Armillaria solidipes]
MSLVSVVFSASWLHLVASISALALAKRQCKIQPKEALLRKTMVKNLKRVAV